ncbi:MAG: hypothetical protein E7407_03815 [Ruminococcaceae bacterium]|nr:hypothetical protein [Oscillospiraceae bacterium]
MARYCTHCGNEVNENAVVCVKCGCAIPQTAAQSGQVGYNPFASASIINTITQRIKTNGIIWIVIAGIQILMGISFNWILLIVGVLNLASSIQDLNYSKEFPNNPVGIVAKMKPLGGAIVVLIYNLVIGGIIGVAGSIYYLIAVRGYVLEHEQAFLEFEKQCGSI